MDDRQPETVAVAGGPPGRAVGTAGTGVDLAGAMTGPELTTDSTGLASLVAVPTGCHRRGRCAGRRCRSGWRPAAEPGPGRRRDGGGLHAARTCRRRPLTAGRAAAGRRRRCRPGRTARARRGRPCCRPAQQRLDEALLLGVGGEHSRLMACRCAVVARSARVTWSRARSLVMGWQLARGVAAKRRWASNEPSSRANRLSRVSASPLSSSSGPPRASRSCRLLAAMAGRRR